MNCTRDKLDLLLKLSPEFKMIMKAYNCKPEKAVKLWKMKIEKK